MVEAGPQKRQRIVELTCDAALCKDSEGNWTKWVVERCTPEQLVVYHQLKEMIKTDPDNDELELD